MTTSSATPLVERVEPFIPDECMVAARAAEAKSGDSTVILAMAELLAITDAFVITSGRNTRQVRTVVDEVERQVAQSGGRRPLRVEGLDDAHWILMDYGDFLVHVFLEQWRQFYDLEHLWADAPRIDWSAGQPGRG